MMESFVRKEASVDMKEMIKNKKARQNRDWNNNHNLKIQYSILQVCMQCFELFLIIC